MCIFAAAPAVGFTAANALVANLAVGATAASAFATPIYSYFAQSQAASAQAQYQQQMYAANQKIAEQSLLSQYADISRRQQQEQEKASQEMRTIAAQAEQARSTAAVSAVESNVSGISVDALMNDYYRKEAQFVESTQRQLRGTLFQLERSKEGLRANYEGQVLSMLPQPVTKPSLFATGLQLGSNAAGLYSDIYLNNYDRRILRTSLGIG